MINTRKVADRRTLRFGRLDDLVTDVETLAAEGDVTASGNWTPGQILDHLTNLIVCSLDGFEVPRAAWPLRLIGGMIRGSMLNKPMKPGIKLPGKFGFMMPATEVSWDDARRRLADTVARVNAGERMTHPSPVFGELSHEQWIQLHCRHAEMHFSFLRRLEA